MNNPKICPNCNFKSDDVVDANCEFCYRFTNIEDKDFIDIENIDDTDEKNINYLEEIYIETFGK